jgi:hypothetical protein
MKKFITLISFIIYTASTFAQVPQGFSYQAEARDASGNPWPNHAITARISITDSIGGYIWYQESQVGTTNQFGLFTLNIGNGTNLIPSRPFNNRHWGIMNAWIHIEYDPNGGTSYQDMGSFKLLSVPYALYADSAVNAANATHATNATHADSASNATNAINATNATLATNAVYSFGPKYPTGFRATNKTTHTVTAATLTPLTYDSVLFNDGNLFSLSGNNFTALTAGAYTFEVAAALAPTSSAGRIIVYLYVNGVATVGNNVYQSSSDIVTANLNATLHLNANDVIGAVVYSFNGGTIVSSSTFNYFSGLKVY